jgi:broad specificity phosphatase PhoE
MTRILLTRHGHVEGIHPPRFRGRREIPLSPLGRKQAGAVAQRIASRWTVSAVYTSPMRRCVDTGAAIADACGTNAHVLEPLVDLDYGSWEWKTYEEMKTEFPDTFAQWFAAPQRVRFPNGESLQDLVARAANVVRTVHARHPTDTVVLVGHASTNRAILLQMFDQPLSAYWRLEQSPCTLNEIDFADHHVRVDRFNDTSHLEGVVEIDG